jgi:hypothetical protein
MAQHYTYRFATAFSLGLSSILWMIRMWVKVSLRLRGGLCYILGRGSHILFLVDQHVVFHCAGVVTR